MSFQSSPEWQKARRGELFKAFVPELVAARDRCKHACDSFNTNHDPRRRTMIELWRYITRDQRPLPPPASTPEEDDELFKDEPWIYAPFRADYGVNCQLGPGSFVNFNCVFIDTCPIILGARTIVGPNCSFYSGSHPIEPAVRKGIEGPEYGKPISVGDDVWVGGNVIVLPGVNIGNGSTIGAGSVVTKDIPALSVAAGNPCKVIRKIEDESNKSDYIVS